MISFPRLVIFCDGGIGNRINSLASGLALAKYFNLPYGIFWPINNWCAADYTDIFNSRHPIFSLTIKELRDKFSDAIVLLHDEIASKALNVSFNSAYEYESMSDFQSQVVSTNQHIFYYPAVFPDWIPIDLIHQEIKTLSFNEYIANEVSNFITQELKEPFYGIHLRRTDLNVGLTDQEVFSVATLHKDKVFFVCSDDPNAEALASVHTNVHCRKKTAHVEKKNAGLEWLAECQDDDERTYFGNISRSKDSVVEGTIDMLILAHSEIIGYSGSTFQKMARLIGEFNPLVNLEKPPDLQFFSVSEIRRKIIAKLIPVDLLLQICSVVNMQGNLGDAIELLELGYEFETDENKNVILFTIGIYYLNNNKPNMASIIFEKLIQEEPTKHSNLLHLIYALLLTNNLNSAKKAFENFNQLHLAKLSNYELNIYEFISNQIKQHNGELK